MECPIRSVYCQKIKMLMRSQARFLAVLIGMLFIFPACAGVFGTRQTAEFEVHLQRVTVEEAGKQIDTFSTDRIENRGDPGMNRHVFDGEILRIEWRLRGDAVRFSVTNRTDDTLQINWNEAVYKANDHRPRTPILSGGRHDVDAPQPVMEIAPGGTRSDHFLPEGYVEHVEGHWKRRHPVLPVQQQTYESTPSFHRRARSWQGARIWIRLPVEQEDERSVYSFQFKIRAVEFPET